MHLIAIILTLSASGQTVPTAAAGASTMSAPASLSEPTTTLRAPVLLSHRVAFADSDAVRVEWQTDLSAIGEVRYGTTTPLAFSADAPVYSRNQSVTIDRSAFRQGIPLYYQISWTDRLGQGGRSSIAPVEHESPTAVREAPTHPAGYLPQPRRPARHARWLIFGGPSFRGRDVGWNIGAAHRPSALPLEAALEFGGFRHKDQSVVYNPTRSDYEQVSKLSFLYLRSRASFLYRTDYIRSPFGERLARFPGYLRAGAGLAGYRVRQAYEVYYQNIQYSDVEVTETQVKMAPYLEAAVIRQIGRNLELALSGEYAFTSHGYGFRDHAFGGAALLLQLAYRFQ